MPEIRYINVTKNPATSVKLSGLKPELKVKDPIRFPAVVEPIEDEFMKGYERMLKNMLKMMSVELNKQIKESVK
jgi:hypothetical protein